MMRREAEISLLQRRLGISRLQAIRNLQGRALLTRRLQRGRRFS
jgi:hypothetical protein